MIVEIGNCRLEILRDGERFRGLGRCWIGETLVRSGRLPLTVHTETFLGAELADLRLLDVRSKASEARICLAGIFRPLATKKMRDHSFDPIHDTGDWDKPRTVGECRLDLVIMPARDSFNGHAFRGFSYHWEYQSRDIAIYYLMEKSTWEIDGDITGVTVYNQSSCSAPEVTFKDDTFWTTEGELFFLDPASCFNRCMTHNLPRWASHQAFDFQFRGDKTLISVFARVDLIRTVLRRDSGKPELKCFDKHIFDETKRYATSAKAILLNTAAKSVTTQKNLWTWIFDEIHNRARAEYDLREQPPVPMMAKHYWVNRTIDTYYKDIVPACAAVGIRAIFLENFRRSDASEPSRLPNGNMCGPHDLEISDYTGGMAKFKEYIARCHGLGIKNYMWTSIHFSLASPINRDHRAGSEKCWFMAMEDTRTKYGGAYTNVLSNLDMRNPEARRYWVDGHRRLVRESGLDGYFIDSFYNLFFMPIDYKTGHPRTVWRAGLEALREVQKAGAGWYIESFGPWGQPQHGHPASYNPATIHLCYYVGMGNNYTTVPVPGVVSNKNFSHEAAFIYWQLAHKSPCPLPLFINKQRIDEVYGPEHRRALREYHEFLPLMHRRYLQEDGLSVVWHDRRQRRALIWNFVDRQCSLPGKVSDLSTGQSLRRSRKYRLAAMHTYAVEAASLPQIV